MSKQDLGTPIGTTLDRFIKSKQDEFKFATGELSQLLRDIALAGKIVNKEVGKAGLADLRGEVGEVNVQGENQQKLDVVAHIRFTRALRNGRMTAAVVSEEEEKIIHINENQNYIVAMDPLDGSSNIDVNVSVGTIFSIYRRKSPVGTKVTKEDILQKGSAQVAAGYILYGSSTMFVYTTGFGVNGFTLDLSLGEFILSHPDMVFPDQESYYSINDSLLDVSDPSISDYVANCKNQGLSARYIGSLVADFHRNMLKGGIYLYPGTSDKPEGKLRLLYECNALAFIAEQAKGVATDGKIRIMDIDPEAFHQRTPFFTGPASLMERLE